MHAVRLLDKPRLHPHAAPGAAPAAENEKRLIKKCQELNGAIVAAAAKVQSALKLSEDDQVTITALKKEIENSWRMVDESHDKVAGVAARGVWAAGRAATKGSCRGGRESWRFCVRPLAPRCALVAWIVDAGNGPQEAGTLLPTGPCAPPPCPAAGAQGQGADGGAQGGDFKPHAAAGAGRRG